MTKDQLNKMSYEELSDFLIENQNFVTSEDEVYNHGKSLQEKMETDAVEVSSKVRDLLDSHRISKKPFHSKEEGYYENGPYAAFERDGEDPYSVEVGIRIHGRNTIVTWFPGDSKEDFSKEVAALLEKFPEKAFSKAFNRNWAEWGLEIRETSNLYSKNKLLGQLRHQENTVILTLDPSIHWEVGKQMEHQILNEGVLTFRSAIAPDDYAEEMFTFFDETVFLRDNTLTVSFPSKQTSEGWQFGPEDFHLILPTQTEDDPFGLDDSSSFQ